MKPHNNANLTTFSIDCYKRMMISYLPRETGSDLDEALGQFSCRYGMSKGQLNKRFEKLYKQPHGKSLYLNSTRFSQTLWNGTPRRSSLVSWARN
ncbi:hypothetical protein Zmor_026373 [Zophobas morio]|uniref:Uncharacterized protein n=1 Tax=Zophobas morio TaxID=2755281 RepID=A0AA38HV80_9CUCU|nr:hypothetical protein Zmor_026373 [Zophobas morio]